MHHTRRICAVGPRRAAGCSIQLNLAIAGRGSMHAFQPPTATRAAVPRWWRRRAGPATPSDGGGHPAMPESRLMGHSTRAHVR